MPATKYINGNKELRRLSEAASKAGYNRQIDIEEFLLHEKVGKKTLLPISFTLRHQHIGGALVEEHMRVVFHYNDQGDSLQLDMSMQDFRALPSIDLDGGKEVG